jgi:hypothetical protein
MTIGTGAIGISPDGQVQVYVPPNVLIVEPPIPNGYDVVYGAPQAIVDGDPLPAGTWEVQSGTLLADGPVTVRSVTVTPL